MRKILRKIRYRNNLRYDGGDVQDPKTKKWVQIPNKDLKGFDDQFDEHGNSGHDVSGHDGHDDRHAEDSVKEKLTGICSLLGDELKNSDDESGNHYFPSDKTTSIQLSTSKLRAKYEKWHARNLEKIKEFLKNVRKFLKNSQKFSEKSYKILKISEKNLQKS